LTPIFVWMVPLALDRRFTDVLRQGKALAAAVEHDVLSESILEGNILIAAHDTDRADRADNDSVPAADSA
jgi:hypothetical protein